MVSCVCDESEVRQHSRGLNIIKRPKNTAIAKVEHYAEVFNPRAQNFRLQKSSPALIIARKHKVLVLKTPKAYGIGGYHNYYFSHMLNCLYDCRYCFLQGMYGSAHQLIFVNYEDFANEISQVVARHDPEPVWFFSGYDCDSLANEALTRFAEFFVPIFAGLDNAWMELRTKSTQIRHLLKLQPSPRIVIAFSFTDHHSHRKLEHGVPSIKKRIDAMQALAEAGWPVGLRFDPIVYHRHYQQAFVQLLEQIFKVIDTKSLHSVSLGAFRLPKDNFKQDHKLFPDEALFEQNLALNNDIISYPLEQEQEMRAFCEQQLLQRISPEIYFPCNWHD
jgi:spore photoproduct lyase